MKKHERHLYFLPAIVLLVWSLYLGWKHYEDTTICIRVPIKLSSANTPIINAVIEGKVCPLKIDLGSSFSSLNDEVLEKINKKPADLVKWKNIKGDLFKTSLSLVPRVNIGNFLWKNVLFYEINAQAKTAGIIWKSPNDSPIEEDMGKLGSPFLEQTNLCLDLYHRTIYICNNLKTLKRKGICPKDMLKVPFLRAKGLMIVQAETDVGKLNLLFDTCSSLSALKSSLKVGISEKKDRRGLHFFTTSRLELAGTNFGKLDIHLLDCDPSFEKMDGILGMNFFENHIVYIDYPNQMLYIGDCHFENN